MTVLRRHRRCLALCLRVCCIGLVSMCCHLKAGPSVNLSSRGLGTAGKHFPAFVCAALIRRPCCLRGLCCIGDHKQALGSIGKFAQAPLRKASVACAAAAEAAEVVGMGYCSAPIEGVDAEAVWNAMLLKTGERIVDFLPVSAVKTKRLDRFTWRSMLFIGPGPLHGKTLLQHIYADQGSGEIRFVSVGDDGAEADEEVVNALLQNPLRIEYFKRNVSTEQRIHWPAPRSRTVAAIDKTIQIAGQSDESSV